MSARWCTGSGPLLVGSSRLRRARHSSAAKTAATIAAEVAAAERSGAATRRSRTSTPIAAVDDTARIATGTIGRPIQSAAYAEAIADAKNVSAAAAAASAPMSGIRDSADDRARRAYHRGCEMRDLRLALRTLRATPVASAVAVLSLALGIGANTAIFSLVNGLLLRPLPVTRPDLLLGVATGNEPVERSNFSYATFAEIRRHADAFDGALAFSNCCGESTVTVGSE